MARPSVSKTLFSQRLTAVREAVGFKERKAFAQKLGMNAETLGGYERGDAQPDYEFVVMYKKEFSVNIDWLITGEGEMFDGPRSVAPPANSRANLDQPDFIRITSKTDMSA